MRLIILPVIALLISCTSAQNKIDKPKDKVGQNVMDSSTYFRNAILGKWYFPGNPNIVMEIKGGSVEYMEGFMEVRYSILNDNLILLFNPDESIDTVETKIISDTLFQREFGVDSFTKYTRHP